MALGKLPASDVFSQASAVPEASQPPCTRLESGGLSAFHHGFATLPTRQSAPRNRILFAGVPNPAADQGLILEDAQEGDIEEIMALTAAIERVEYDSALSEADQEQYRLVLRTLLVFRQHPGNLSMLKVFRRQPVDDQPGKANPIVGVASMYHDPALPEWLLLHTAYLLPEYRGNGTYRALLEWVIEQAREAGVEELELAGRPPSAAITGKAGFREVGRIPENGLPILSLRLSPATKPPPTQEASHGELEPAPPSKDS